MKKVNLADWIELLYFAEKIGYSWNKAHEILVKDNVPPSDGIYVIDYNINDLDNYNWSEDSLKIVKGYMEHNEVEEVTFHI